MSDIFVEKISDKSEVVDMYKKCLWGKVHSRYITDMEKCNSKCDSAFGLRISIKDSRHTTWTQIAVHLPYFLPFAHKEKKIIKKYPLQPDDPSVKMSYAWQKYNWLSIDEDEEELVPSCDPKKEEQKAEEPFEIPKCVKSSSQKCIESFSRLYDTFADLDVLESFRLLTVPGREKDDVGRLKCHPMDGLSDLEGQHVHWAPHTLTPELAEEYAHVALNHCYNETREVLESLPSKDWEQLSLPIQENQMPTLLKNQLSSDEK